MSFADLLGTYLDFVEPVLTGSATDLRGDVASGSWHPADHATTDSFVGDGPGTDNRAETGNSRRPH